MLREVAHEERSRRYVDVCGDDSVFGRGGRDGTEAVACTRHGTAGAGGRRDGDDERTRAAAVRRDRLVRRQGSRLWQAVKGGGPAKWKVENGYFEVVKGTGDIATTRGFGDCQLHVEWMAPAPPVGEGQDRGNSGVFFMGMYEVQVLDSYKSRTYPDGQASALYGQHPPLVNASRAPGEWQSTTSSFARHDSKGTRWCGPRASPYFTTACWYRTTREMTGPTGHKSRPPYQPHADALPIRLQDHAHPVRFRNIWIRELKAGSGS